MGINVSTSMGFSNREFQRKSSKEFVRKQEQIANKSHDAEISNAEIIIDTSLTASAVSNVSDMININGKLMETLKYLQTHANYKRKNYNFGELWEMFEKTAENTNEIDDAELIDLNINFSEHNIFAA